jgi:aspartate racemase
LPIVTAHIGIVACSPPGAALCFETICAEVGRRGACDIEVSIHAHSFVEYMRHVDTRAWDRVAELMVSSADKLASVGAQLLVAPCNTIHAAFDLAVPRSRVPWLHIAEEVATVAQQRDVRRLALLGTRETMEGPIYRTKLALAGIDYCVPPATDRARLDTIIFNELVRGVVTPESRDYFRSLIGRMEDGGCDAVGLCCTELPLVVAQTDVGLPLLDSTRVLALAAVHRALGTAF